MLEKARGVKLMKTGDFGTNRASSGSITCIRRSTTSKARQAMYHLINQEDFLRAIVGDPDYYKVCHGMIDLRHAAPRTTPARDVHEGVQSEEGACSCCKEAGYNGEPITILAATDHNTITPATQVLIQAMREAGLNVDVQSMDWGSVVSRRAKKEPPAQGGWNIFVTTMGTVGASNPVLHTWIGAACDKGLVRLAVRPRGRGAAQRLGFAATDDEKKKIAQDLQARADRAGRATFRSASGTRRSPIGPTGSMASCRTPA